MLTGTSSPVFAFRLDLVMAICTQLIQVPLKKLFHCDVGALNRLLFVLLYYGATILSSTDAAKSSSEKCLDEYVIEYGEDVLLRDRVLSSHRYVEMMR